MTDGGIHPGAGSSGAGPGGSPGPTHRPPIWRSPVPACLRSRPGPRARAGRSDRGPARCDVLAVPAGRRRVASRLLSLGFGNEAVLDPLAAWRREAPRSSGPLRPVQPAVPFVGLVVSLACGCRKGRPP